MVSRLSSDSSESISFCFKVHHPTIHTPRHTLCPNDEGGHNQIRPKSNIMYNKRVRVRMQVWRSLLGREPFGHVHTQRLTGRENACSRGPTRVVHTLDGQAEVRVVVRGRGRGRRRTDTCSG